MLDNAELQSLIDDLDELSVFLWMQGEEQMDIALKLDEVVDKHRPEGMVGD